MCKMIFVFMIFQLLFFFNFSKSFDFPGCQGVKGQEMDQNGKKILSVAPSISVTIYHMIFIYVSRM